MAAQVSQQKVRAAPRCAPQQPTPGSDHLPEVEVPAAAAAIKVTQAVDL